MKNGVEVDLISSEESFADYQVLVAPMLYLLKPGVARRMKEFTEAGGQLLATYITGYVDEHTLCYLGGFPGDGLTELFGLYTEEIDTLFPKDTNGAAFLEDAPVEGTYKVRDYCEIVKLQGARTLAVYTDDFYKNTPVVTVNPCGKGKAYYVAARMEASGMEAVLRYLWQQAGIEPKSLPEGVEYHRRLGEGVAYDFYLNYTNEEKTVTTEQGVDLLTGSAVGGKTVLPPLGVIVCRVQL